MDRAISSGARRSATRPPTILRQAAGSRAHSRTNGSSARSPSCSSRSISQACRVCPPIHAIARFVVAPLRLEGGRVGALTATLGERLIDERELRLLAGLAHQAKIAIESAEHYDNLERTFVSTVASLANALEANDEYTSSHARWITDMSLLVGRELRLDRDALKRLEFGALFHDIGKIGIPSEILQKPGPLTDDEFEIVKQHPELGEKILAPIERLADVRPIVRSCHERWDGLGYPDGKSGLEIPVEARIVLVCDAFHAMTTDRPYRDAPPGRRGRSPAYRVGRIAVRPDRRRCVHAVVSVGRRPAGLISARLRGGGSHRPLRSRAGGGSDTTSPGSPA